MKIEDNIPLAVCRRYPDNDHVFVLTAISVRSFTRWFEANQGHKLFAALHNGKKPDHITASRQYVFLKYAYDQLTNPGS